MAEAVRRYVALAEESSAGADSPASLRGTASLPPTAIGLGAARLDQLHRDMALTPEARIREAEETVRLTTVRQKGRPSQLLMFDRFEDYLEWKRRDLA